MKRSRLERRTPLRAKKRIRAKSSRRKINQALDTYYKEVIHARDGWQCQGPEHIKHNSTLQAHHVFEKGRCGFMRFEPDNLLTLCSACHMWWHHAPGFAREDWFRSKWPHRYEKLMEIYRKAEKINPKQLYEELSK